MLKLMDKKIPHKEWRKVAKKERRRKIRVKLAIERDKLIDPKELILLEKHELEVIERTNRAEHLKWLLAKEKSLAAWNELQMKNKLLQQEKLEREAKIQQEWEMEQKRIKEETERLRKIEEEQRIKHETFMRQLDEFLSGNTEHAPDKLLDGTETRPGADSCPFFNKTSCCRFGDNCSRNHRYPGITKVLLATNFYTHFGLNNSTPNEYDTDILLEYEESETYKDFKEFFFDVFEEFKKFGKILAFQVCYNQEKHLRGNTYVEYAELRSAVAAYKVMHTRWYGGKQISLQFSNITQWQKSICGLHIKNKCPKGRTCNYLHVFRNPINIRSYYDDSRDRDRRKKEKKKEEDRPHRTSARSWRWSESPEVEIPKKSERSGRSNKKHRDEERYNDRDKTQRCSDRRIRSERSYDRVRRSPETC